MPYEHRLIKPYDNLMRGTGKLKDQCNLCIGKETHQEEQGDIVQEQTGGEVT